MDQVQVTPELLAEIEEKARVPLPGTTTHAGAEFYPFLPASTVLALVQHIRKDQEAINAALFDLTATWEAIGQVCSDKVEEIAARVEALRKERGSE